MIVVAQYALPELDQLAAAAPADGDRRFTGQPKLRQVMTTVNFRSTLNPYAKMTSIDVDLSHGSDIKDIRDVFSHSSSQVARSRSVRDQVNRRTTSLNFLDLQK